MAVNPLAGIARALGFSREPALAPNSFRQTSFAPQQVAWTQKATTQPIFGTMFSSRGGFGWSGGYTGFGYTPQEPFSGAWQKNVTASNMRDPNLLAVSGVYACTTIISQDISAMALRLMRLKADGVSEEVHRNSPYHKLLRKPNWYQTSLEFVQFMLVSRLLRGNAYVYKELDARGVPNTMHLLHPDRTRPLVDPDTKDVWYEFQPHVSDLFSVKQWMLDGSNVARIPARLIIHDRINCLWHPLIGTSPLFAAAITAMTAGRIIMNTESLFANMARPSGFLTSASTIQDPTADRLKREFEANYSGGNIGRTAVLGDGLEWKSMVMTSTDAQLIEQLKWTIEDIARCFRVPMYLLADVTRMTYKNSEQAAQSYYSGCLRYHVEEIEARFSTDFDLDEAVEYVAFDVRSMFRMDTQERFNAYRAGIAAAVLAPNEARAWEGLGPVEGGEEPRMQMQYVPLSTPVAAPAPPAPPAAAPAPDAGDGGDTPPADDGEDPPPDPADDTAENAAALETLAIMKRVSVMAARARFAFEERRYAEPSA